MVQKLVVCCRSYTWNNFALVPCTTKQQSTLLALKIDILPPGANFSAIFFPLCNRHPSLLFPTVRGAASNFQFHLMIRGEKMKHQHFRTYSGKDSTCQYRRCNKRCGFDPWVRKIHQRGKWQSTPVFLPGKAHGQRSLLGYSSWGHSQSVTTQHLRARAHTHTHTHTHTHPRACVLNCFSSI